MQDIYFKKLSLSDRFFKLQGKILSDRNTKVTNAKDITEKKEISDNFYKLQKELLDNYQAEKYKLDIKEAPSIHTMTSAVNFKQKILLDDMNKQIAAARQELKKELSNGRYNFLEETAMQKGLSKFEEDLKQRVFKDIDDFRDSYCSALCKKDFSKINDMENSLLSNLLSKI